MRNKLKKFKKINQQMLYKYKLINNKNPKLLIKLTCIMMKNLNKMKIKTINLKI